MRTLSAPGKVVVAGEYAVLDGCPAIVAAVSARAFVRWARRPDRLASGADGSRGTPALPPELVLTRSLAEERLGPLPDVTLELDTQALRQGDKKYGLGSSAAAAAATAFAVLDAHGQADAPGSRALALELAFAGHRAIAPKGSGVDVAAACLGGWSRFRREGERIAEASPIAFPAALEPVLLWTGSPARTSELVAQVEALRDRDPSAHRAAIDRIASCARAFAAALPNDPAAALAALDAHGEAMAALGRDAGAPIVTPALAEAAALARAVGGAAKPSGAGGGDIAIALVPGPDAAAELRARALRASLLPLDAALGVEGVRVEPASPHEA
jgi:phosphomevalonate kinase